MFESHLNYDDKEYWDKRLQVFRECGSSEEYFKEIDDIWCYFKYCLETQNRFFFSTSIDTSYSQ